MVMPNCLVQETYGIAPIPRYLGEIVEFMGRGYWYMLINIIISLSLILILDNLLGKIINDLKTSERKGYSIFSGLAFVFLLPYLIMVLTNSLNFYSFALNFPFGFEYAGADYSIVLILGFPITPPILDIWTMVVWAFGWMASGFAGAALTLWIMQQRYYRIRISSQY